MSERFTGYIYCIRLYTRPVEYVKIGHTFDIRARMRQYRQGIPLFLDLAAQFEGTRPEESAIHRMLCKAQAQDEWYFATEEVIDFIITGEFINAEKKWTTLRKVPCLTYTVDQDGLDVRVVDNRHIARHMLPYPVNPQKEPPCSSKS